MTRAAGKTDSHYNDEAGDSQEPAAFVHAVRHAQELAPVHVSAGPLDRRSRSCPAFEIVLLFSHRTCMNLSRSACSFF